MPITFHGVASVPADNGSSALTQTTITPPASMLSGDLVLVYCRQRGTAVWSVGLTGGQTWTTYDTPNSTNISVATFYCVFNGTWSVNPRFDSSAGTHTSVQMLVFRPSAGFRFVQPHYLVSTNEASTAAVTATALTHTQASNLSVVGWHTADDNTWGTLTGAGWVKTGLSAQYRNLAGNDGSCTYAYRIGTATGTTGTVAQTQLTLGPDLTRWSHLGFYEELIPTGTVYNETTNLSLSVLDVYNGQSIINSTLTLLTDKSVDLNGSLSFQDSVLIDFNVDITSQLSLILNDILNISLNIDINSAGGSSIFDSISLITNKDIVTQSNNSLQDSITLDVFKQLNSNHINILNEAIELLITNDINSLANSLINLTLALSSESNVSSIESIIISEFLIFDTVNDIVLNSTSSINTSLTLSINSLDDYQERLTLNESFVITFDSATTTSSINSINESLLISFNSDLFSSTTLILEALVNITSNNDLLNLINISINETVNLLSNNSLNTSVQIILQEILNLSLDIDLQASNTNVLFESTSIHGSTLFTSSSISILNELLNLNFFSEVSSFAENTLNAILNLVLDSQVITADSVFFFYEESVIISLSSNVTSSAIALMQAAVLLDSLANVGSATTVDFLANVILNTDISQGEIKNITLDDSVSIETSKGIITVAAKTLFEALTIAIAVQQNFSSTITYQESLGITLNSDLEALVNHILTSNLLLTLNLDILTTAGQSHLSSTVLNTAGLFQVLAGLILNDLVTIEIENQLTAETQSFTFNEGISLVLNTDLYVDGTKNGILILRSKSNIDPLSLRFSSTLGSLIIRFKPKE